MRSPHVYHGDMNRPSGLADDYSDRSAIQSLMTCTSSVCFFLDSLQSRVDLSIWPDLLEDCFAFVANYQMLSPVYPETASGAEIVHFIRTNASLARHMELLLTEISSQNN